MYVQHQKHSGTGLEIKYFTEVLAEALGIEIN